ncbi:hypothetical protein E2C01_069188 [Portunus trituberculatus]|uniref:Uncharacterized protein n=1 Tax=Portunus trituberculatus TaxID=210409 RepID=A0A5B7HTX3_PORTR|nr:hypothetical protein [Portunus trituberculatus]
MESKFCKSEKWGKQACISLIDSRFEEEKKNEEVHTNFRKLIKEQERERNELAQREIKETIVRNIAKRKSVIVSGLREDNIRNWQERKKMEEERIRNLLNQISEEDDVFSEVEDYMRLGKYEEGKTRAIKITLKS